jgi:hypothetical protein
MTCELTPICSVSYHTFTAYKAHIYYHDIAHVHSMTSDSIKLADVPQLSGHHWNLLVDEMDMYVDNDDLPSNDD